MLYIDKKYKKEVSIDYPLYQSDKGRYFIGQTPILSGQDGYTLAALYNPCCSNINIYLNAITVTNTSVLSISAEIYLNSKFFGGIISNLISCANTSIIPQPIPHGEIQYLNSTTQPPMYGVAIFGRIVSPYSTLVIDGSQIIIGPGQYIIIYLGEYLPVSLNSTVVAFGWWEEEIPPCNTCHN